MKDLREKQLKQGDPVDTEKNDYTPIGKPQIAVLTISGNDVLFSKVINDCVYRLWILGKMKGCDQRLREVEGMIDSTNFKNDILNTYLSIVAAGRCAGGANPMASFQVFVGKREIFNIGKAISDTHIIGGYVGLWNHHDEPCDHVYWNYIGWGLTYKQWLTRSLRKRMNDLVDKLNRVVKEAAEELKPYGVFYVEGYNDGFMGRRFCEHYKHNCIHHRAFQDRNGENGFWSYKSRAFRGDEGWPAERICDWDLISLENGNPPELAEEEDLLLRDISEVLVPNEEDRKKLSDELGPWNVTEGDWDQYDDIFEALLDRGQHDPMKAKSVWDKYFRLFHPKASGYAYFADKWMEAIKANRDDPADKPADEPAKAGKTLQLFWQVEPGPEMPINDFPLSEDEYLWKFYLGDTGTGSNPCNTDPVDIKTNGEAPKDNPPTVVNGEWEFDLPDMGKCKFQGIGRVGESGENGWLHCQTRPAIMCKPDERPIDDCGTDNIVRSKAISFCDW
jgi:hypothetical protein